MTGVALHGTALEAVKILVAFLIIVGTVVFCMALAWWRHRGHSGDGET